MNVVYLISGRPHLPYLVVSLCTLRERWGGSVQVFAYPESIEAVRRIAEDKRLGVEARQWNPIYLGKNGQGINRIKLMTTLETSCNAYLDADTSIHGDLSSMFQEAQTCGHVGTQFCNWLSTGNIISGRLKRMRAFAEIDQTFVEEVVNNTWPSINCGVFACMTDSVVMEDWFKWTMACRSIFIADEVAQHPVMVKYSKTNEFSVITGGAFNCSPIPKYQPSDLEDDDVVVRHYHGDSNTRLKKSRRGYQLWWPMLERCRADNIGGINDWFDTCRNKHIDRLLKGDLT